MSKTTTSTFKINFSEERIFFFKHHVLALSELFIWCLEDFNNYTQLLTFEGSVVGNGGRSYL